MNKEKLSKLEKELMKLGSVAVAFSGGVDSTFLLYVAKQVLGDNVLAITIDGTAISKREIEDVREFLKDWNIKNEIIKVNQLDIEGFADNNPDRCYVCKKALFSMIKDIAKKHGIINVVEGTNQDDLGDFRPGMKALDELTIISPLKNAGINKSEIREWSKSFGLNTFDKPSNPCMATRIKTGEKITEEKLVMIEKAEDYLIDLGFEKVRVRMIGDDTSIEVDKDRVSDLEKINVEETLKSIGFKNVSINKEGYVKGRMNG